MRNPTDAMQTVAQLKKEVESNSSFSGGVDNYTQGLLSEENLTSIENNQTVNNVSDIAGDVVNQAKDVFANVVETAGIIKDKAGNALSKAGDILSDTSLDGQVDQIFNKMGFNDDGQGLFANAIEKAGGQTSISTKLKQSYEQITSDPEVKEAVDKRLSDGDIDGAFEVMKDAGLSLPNEEEVKSILEATSNTVSQTLVYNESNLEYEQRPIISSDFNQDKKFSYVSSIEELESDMRLVVAAARQISECIIHYSESYTNSNWSAEDIDELNRAVGFDEIVYHYVIKRDGSIQRGRDVTRVGEHCPVLNHNAYSIGIIIIGGLNIPSSSEQFEDVATAAPITLSQFNSLWNFLRTFYNYYPGGQVLGHRDIDITQEDPGFNVIEYCRAEFGKESLYCDPTIEPAMSIDDIVRHQRVTNINDHFTSIGKDDF